MMGEGCKYIKGLILLLVTCSSLEAQVSVRANVDKDKILIGEPISLTVEAYVPLGAVITWINTDTIPHFEFISRQPVDTAQNMDGKKISQSFVITSFDSGQWHIPSFELIVDERPYYTDSILVNISFTPFDPQAEYRDIKNIIEFINPSVKYIPWVLSAAAFASFITLIILIRRRRTRQQQIKVKDLPIVSPYEEAMRALANLSLKEHSNGEVKAYYSEMNDILRKYIARRFNISTFERTNEELILQLSNLYIPKESFIRLVQSLRMSDFVKFAKYLPSADDNNKNLDIVRTSIDLLDKNFISAV